MSTFIFVADDTTIDVLAIIAGVAPNVIVNASTLNSAESAFAVDISDEISATNEAIEAALRSKGGRSFSWTVNEVLRDAQLRRINELAVDVTVYIEGHYNTGRKESLLMLMAEALDDALNARMVHIRTATGWIGGVIDEYIAKTSSVMLQTTITGVEDVEIDFSAYDSSDPRVTMQSSLAVST